MNRNVFKNVISESSEFDKEKVYWLRKFSGDLTKSYFPYDLIRTNAPDFDKDTIEFKFPGNLSSKLNYLTNNSDNNLFAVFATGLTVLLSKYTGNEDIVIGMPILKQEVEGEFLNVMLAQRNQATPLMELKKLLMQIKQTINEANDHSNYPIERLEYYLGLENIEKGSSLFETVILLQNIHERKYIEKMNYNIVFLFNRTDGFMEGTLEYNNRLYRRETAESIVSHLLNTLQNMIGDFNASIYNVEILSEKERETLLNEFNDTHIQYPENQLFHEIFEDQVKKTPDNKAVIAMDNYSGEMALITYTRLNESANQLARYLTEKGVGPDAIIGVMLEPSLEMAKGILAVSKAGGAFLPIDPESPGDRIEYLLKESDCSILLTQEPFIKKINFNGEKINIENKNWRVGDNTDLERKNQPGDLFYTIYTSGTTGRPKGGLLSHRNLVNYVTWFSKMAQLTDKDKTILTSSYAYDLGYSIFLGSLSTGGELHIIPKESYINAEKLLEYIKTKEISYLKMTPSLFSVVVNNNIFSKETCITLRLLILGGEEINTKDVEKAHNLCDHIKFMNHYGPTETAIGSVSRFIDFSHFEEYKKNPTIGKPIHNANIYILDKHIKLAPIGVPGELFIGGKGVSRGYLNHPELTSEKFIQMKPGQACLSATLSLNSNTLYKTGDLARWTTDGNIQFLGRKDTQVKIRGFRIELGEIETQILKSRDVKEVVVQAMEDKKTGKFLCAYIVSTTRENPIDVSELKKLLSNNLPDFMIPSHFVPIDKIPLTPNGKLDKNALAKIEISWGGDEYTSPENEDQSKMIEIWSEVLGGGKDKIGIHDNFFELGGHSLSVMFLVSKIHKEFNVKISLVEVFKFPTPAGLVQYIKESGIEESYRAIELEEEKEYYPLSSPQRRFYLAQQLNRENTAYNIPGILTLDPGFSQEKLEFVFKELIKRHESLRTSFKIINNEPSQIIHNKVDFKIDYQNTQAENAAKAIENFIKPFDLNIPPLLRVGLINTGQEKILVLNIHHIISDGVSIQVLTQEFNVLAENMQLDPLPLQYKDFASWQNHWFGKKSYKKMEKYWMDTLDKFKITRLPEDTLNRNGIVRGNYETAIIEKNTYLKINEFCTQYKMTRFSFMVSLFLLIITKETGENDITIGIPVENRDHVDLKNIFGVFLNVFLLRAIIDRGETIKSAILKINNNFIDALGNSVYPYEELYYRLREHYQLPDDELFTILFNYLPNVRAEESQAEKSKTVSQIPFEITPKYPVSIYLKDTNDKINLQLLYRSDLFSKNRIERIIHNYFKFIEIAVTHEDTIISDLVYEDVEKSNSLNKFEGEFENEDLF